MRLPYCPVAPPVFPLSSGPKTQPTTATAYAQLSARRSPKPLQALDLTLLHSPPVASGWSSFLGAIRTQTSLPADIRELCICRVAVLNGADYEWEHHVPILVDEGRVPEAAIEEIKERKAWRGWEGEAPEEGKGEAAQGEGLSERYRAVVSIFRETSSFSVVSFTS